MNDETITKCDNGECGWQGPWKAKVRQRRADGYGHDHVCPKCGHDTFTLPFEGEGVLLVLQLQPGEAWMAHPYAEKACLILDAEGGMVKNQFGPLDLPWRVWGVNDCEWMLARTREEAVFGLVQHIGPACSMVDVAAVVGNAWDIYTHEEWDEIRPLDADTLLRLHYCTEEWDGKPENYTHWQCECGAMADNTCRWNGSVWEHPHPYPVGHVAMRNIHRWSFQEELEKRLQAGARCELFASSEC